ncbi:hypothetical protein EVAR_94367_1 [Eumeta japonica]|uniref:Uncharacterized protein n=1 Tax=Eumeta variegata TaxID=151549 RepID=A0A4C1TPX1_EUMVA|nr:hypothetical protein EVAR_94367_1 [Eumeta japonica]
MKSRHFRYTCSSTSKNRIKKTYFQENLLYPTVFRYVIVPARLALGRLKRNDTRSAAVGPGTACGEVAAYVLRCGAFKDHLYPNICGSIVYYITRLHTAHCVSSDLGAVPAAVLTLHPTSSCIKGEHGNTQLHLRHSSAACRISLSSSKIGEEFQLI